QEKSGQLGIHAYDEEATLVGQGTVAREWQEQCPEIDTVLVAVGGGGLIGGMAAWYQGDVKVVACEPKRSCAYHEADTQGSPVDVSIDGIAADSLGARRIGSLMFPIAQQFVAESVVVDDEEIVRAQCALWSEVQVMAEPGGATALAALLSGAYTPEPGERVGVLICGGNTSTLSVLGQC
ncbi:MAG: pyridoxal-phosphate dependent enzyme, partial [Kofleriaceae bacterium]|nr:pyridoxal-phosphate dependent enzyme [Kofleriaceae bacterium]